MARSRRRFTREYKESVVRKLIESNKTMDQIAQEEEISISSLNRWKKELGEKLTTENLNSGESSTWTSRDKFMVVMETYSMNEIELGEYCRVKGLYREQVNEWRKACIGANDKKDTQDKGLTAQLKEEQKKQKDLEKELRKKDKALAEMGALLVLSKKAHAIWGEPGDE